MIVFIPELGIKGIWVSLFNSVSAFCNAGMDIIGDVSLCDYANNPIINFTTSCLIVLGGIGFIVWWDILRVLKNFKNRRFRCFKSLTLHTKIVLSSTFILILFGALFVFIFEYLSCQRGNDGGDYVWRSG